MTKITLKLQDLASGDTSFLEVEDEAAAIAWLKERPRFTDVLGVVFEGLTREQNDRLRAAMRPLDEEERAAEAKLAAAAQKAKDEARAMRLMEEQAAQAAHRNAVRNADPNRPMEVRYRYDSGVSPLDANDGRELSPETIAAIEEWIAERNDWVKDRNQVVGEAKLSVWPGALPKPGMDRIQAGSFIPVAAPEKPEAAS
ncbi:MAG: hypothetical protein R3B70_00680 [Polyangiaceae bacterium]